MNAAIRQVDEVVQPVAHAATSQSITVDPKAMSHPDNVWVVDSGAANHVTHDSDKFDTISPHRVGWYVITGDGEAHPITHVGDVRLPLSKGFLIIRHVFLVPSFKYNLLSLSDHS